MSSTAASGTPEAPGLPLKLICVLALLSATPPVSTDLYLASFPEMTSGLHTDAQHVQLTLTAFLLGIGLGQLFWGPLSDRYGRWRPMFVGTVVATVASLISAMAPSVELLIGARFVQALAASATLVIGRAVISDLARGFRAAQAMSLMMTINSFAPIAAPVLGGLLAGHVPWRGVLGVIGAVMVIQTVCVLLVVRESLPADRRAPALSFRPLGTMIAQPTYRSYALTVGFCFGALMSYISSSSFVYQKVIDLPGWAFGVGFGVNSVALLIAGARSTRRAHRQIHPATTVRLALPWLLGGTVGVLACTLSPWPALLLAPLLVTVTAVGFIIGNVVTLAMNQARLHSGAGSALVGASQFLVGGAFSALTGVAGEETAVPMGICMVVSALLCVLCFGRARATLTPASEAVFAAPAPTQEAPADEATWVGASAERGDAADR
ncbi:multidrug effflux MFS transporter [Nocardioides sp.]|uniref:multidrug effflux MFS transporter n=1 Tax=Nocardioides sp. TaxID=35761 RepID=UPI00260ED565|nr:multidrug effflux MFS transporter [Nocardioides sp.]